MTPSVCTVSGVAVTLVNVGSCTITANQAGDGNYSAAPQMSQTFKVSPSVTNGVVNYAYDALGRLVQVIAPAGISSQYSYDSDGNLLSNASSATSGVTITSFNPSSAPVGTSITISGSGFGATTSSNSVTFSGMAATVLAATATSLQVIVPNGATTGSVAVVSANGTGTSTANFFVAALAENNVPVTINLSANESVSFTFSGTAGDELSLNLSNVSTVPSGGTVTATITQVGGTILTTCTTTVTNSLCTLPNLPVPGNYTITLSSGAIPATITASLNSPSMLTINGPPVTATLTSSSTLPSYVFNGTAGQNLVLQFSNVLFPGGTQFVVRQPNGAVVFSASASSTIATYDNIANVTTNILQGWELTNLPVTGTYSLQILPQNSGTGSVVVSLQTAIFNSSGNTAAISISNGQYGLYSFNGIAGQSLWLGLDGLTIANGGTLPPATIADPNGLVIDSFSPSANMPLYALPILTTTGAYTVLINSGVSAATFNLQLLQSSASLIANGSPPAVSIGNEQYAVFTFSGTAGQNLGLGLTALAITYSGLANGLTVTITDPNGGLVGSFNALASTPGFVLPTLTKTGTYVVSIYSGSSSATFNLQLSSDMTGNIVVGGPAVTFASNIPGQAGTYTFNGTAGQDLSLQITNNTYPPPPSTSYASPTYSIYQPGGIIPLASLINLPVTGAYIMRVAPVEGATGSVTMSFIPGVMGTVTSNGVGTAVNLSTDQLGQFTFVGTSGQSLVMALSSLAITPSSGEIGVTITGPNSFGISFGLSEATPSYALPTLPATGTYTILFNTVADAATFNLNLNSTIVSAPLNIDGSATATSLTGGQQASYSFTGAIGQNLGLGFVSLVTAPTTGGSLNVTVQDPNNSVIGSTTVSAATPGYALPTLTKAGTYTVLVNPSPNAATFSVLLSSDAIGSLLTNGTPTTFAPTRTGQAATYTFSGTIGQELDAVMTGDTFPSSTMFSVYQQNGSLVANSSLNGTSAGVSGTMPLPNLPATGSYTLRTTPTGGLGSVTLGLVPTLSGTLGFNGSGTAINLMAGQLGQYTFTGSIGQNLALGLSGLAINPTNGWVVVTITDPNNNQIGSFAATATQPAYTLPMLTTAGAYTVSINPGANAATFALLLSSDVAGTLATNDVPLVFTSNTLGQAASYTFSGAAGQSMNFIISGDTIPGSTQFNVYESNGTSIATTTYAFSSGAGTGGELSVVLPAAGTYTIRIMPQVGGTGSVSVAAVPTLTGTISINGSAVVSLAAGQPGIYTFNGLLGQSLALGVTGLAMTPTGGSLTVKIFDPNGAQVLDYSGSHLGPFTVSGTAGSNAIPVLTLSGPYTVVVNPEANTANFNLYLSADVTGTIAINGPAFNVTTTLPGQAATYTFTGTSGQSTTITMVGNTFPGNTYFYFYEGTYLLAGYYLSTAIGGLPGYFDLPETGSYTLRFIPQGGGAGTLSATLQ